MAFHSNLKQDYYYYDPSNTTFVQADPSNFRAVVQRLTGAPPPVTNIPGRPCYRLHERRQSGRNFEIKLGSAQLPAMVMASPVSPLDIVVNGPQSPSPEEDRSDIADKGFYLHLSPLSTPRSSEPELLTLFPLYSPRDDPN